MKSTSDKSSDVYLSLVPVKLTLDEVKRRVSMLWDGVAKLDETSYIDQRQLARFVDRDFGEWWARPFHLMKGTGRHPLRARASSASSRKLSAEEVDRRTRKRHDDNVSLRIETYGGNTHVKALFVDTRYGEWWALPYAVMQGMGHPKGRLKKAIATMRSYQPVFHWQTGDECHSASGFEHAVLIWLNHNRYDFDWQVPILTSLTTPKGRQVIYNVDVYVKSGPFADTYVEIKGTWSRRSNNDGGKTKWEWFHANFPNSQLWMRSDLERLGIIDAQRAYLSRARK